VAEDEAEAEGGKKPEAETAPEAGETPEPVTEQQPRPEAGPGAGETPAEIAEIEAEPEAGPGTGETPSEIAEIEAEPEAGPGTGETPSEIAVIEAEPEAGPGAGETPSEIAVIEAELETGSEVEAEAEAEPETEEKAEQEALEPSGGETDDASVNGEAPGEETAWQTPVFRWIPFSFQGRIARFVYWLRGILPFFSVPPEPSGGEADDASVNGEAPGEETARQTLAFRWIPSSFQGRIARFVYWLRGILPFFSVPPEPSGGEADDASVNGEAPGEEAARQTPAFRWILFSFQGRIARSVYWLRGVLPIFAVTLVLPLALVVLSKALGLQQQAAPTAASLFILSTDHGQVSVKDASGLAGVKVSAGESPSEQPDAPSFEKTVDTGIFRLTAVQTLAGKSGKEKIRWRFSAAREAVETPLFITIIAVTAGIVLFLFIFWTSLAVGAKRCHDRGRSGWFQLISLIPFIGSLWLLVELGILKGKEGGNRFGPDPLA
jgi:uncharacterized membrane protein YhaH (DUF805 family)